MAFDPTEFFNLYDIFFNEIVGDVLLGIIIFLVLLSFFTLKFKMPLQLLILFSVLFLAIMFAETLMIMLWVFIVLIVGLLFYYIISKIFGGGG